MRGVFSPPADGVYIWQAQVFMFFGYIGLAVLMYWLHHVWLPELINHFFPSHVVSFPPNMPSVIDGHQAMYYNSAGQRTQ